MRSHSTSKYKQEPEPLPADDQDHDAGDQEEALDGNESVDSVDEEMDNAWREYAQADLDNAISVAQAVPLPEEKPRGFIVLEGRTLGRIYSQPRLQIDPSVHVACYRHAGCQNWVKLHQVPDTRLIRIWLQRAPDFTDADDHWQVI